MHPHSSRSGERSECPTTRGDVERAAAPDLGVGATQQLRWLSNGRTTRSYSYGISVLVLDLATCSLQPYGPYSCMVYMYVYGMDRAAAEKRPQVLVQPVC
jgi:hypothetical protein